MNKSLVIGLYGISGSGKSYLLQKLRQRRPEWLCLEGSDVINEIIPIELFKTLPPQEKESIRIKAAKKIRAISKGCISIVAGHASFPASNGLEEYQDVFGTADEETYDAIIWLNADPSIVAARRQADLSSGRRERMSLSPEQLTLWMKHEETLLKASTTKAGIQMIDFDGEASSHSLEQLILSKLVTPMCRSAKLESQTNLARALEAIPRSHTYLLLDGDRTLWPGDTGKLFFQDDFSSLKMIFQRYGDSYPFQAFWESSLLYAQSCNNYESKCRDLAPTLLLYESWKEFLNNVKISEHIHPILVTSGVREIWEQAMSDAELGGPAISIIAGNHSAIHPYIVDAEAKAIVVETLRARFPGCRTAAFGDSCKSYTYINEISPLNICSINFLPYQSN